MKQSHKIRILSARTTALFISLLLFALLCLPSSANSAQLHWRGTSAAGALIKDASCPVVVKQETLTFDISEFPRQSYSSAQEFLSYPSTVTAQYTLYNPADYTVTATLVFPFGSLPDYRYLSDPETGKTNTSADVNRYDITVNNRPVSKTLRHTYSYYNEPFQLDTDLLRLSDSYLKDDFYAPDLPVTKYTFLAEGADTETYTAANAAFSLHTDPDTARIYMEQQSGSSLTDDTLQLSTWVDENTPFSVYVMGEPFENFPDWTFYEDGGRDKEIPGNMKLLETTAMTYEDFALSSYHKDSGILAADWYNAVTHALKLHAWENGTIISSDIQLDITDQLMRWYEYEITLKPKETITNTVTAPVYPSINTEYDPAVFEYEYLLSPAQTWADFGSLNIIIKTPYPMVNGDENMALSFEKTDTGYESRLKQLPSTELYFTLCTEENPEPPKRFPAAPNLAKAILLIAVVLLVSVPAGIHLTRRKGKL